MNGLPDRLFSLFTTEPRAQRVYHVALGSNGAYCVIYSDYDGMKIRHGGLPPELLTWLLSPSGRSLSADRDLSTMKVVLGPDGSHFAFDQSGASWANLPNGLARALEDRREPYGEFKPGAYPHCVALGSRGTYVLLTVVWTVK